MWWHTVTHGRGSEGKTGECSWWVVSSTPRQHFTPGKNPVPILQEAGWAPGPVWTGEKSRPHRDSIPNRPVRSSVTIPTELPGLRHIIPNLILKNITLYNKLILYKCIYIYMYVCVDIYIYIYIHTYIYTHRRTQYKYWELFNESVRYVSAS